ncbi:MAG: hypothetical protein EA417_15945 [Gammaproteobacteria bacterium]|nr:MAG: hypothetical protein EA417_15945 [Gammaproteobacteria bacterium]
MLLGCLALAGCSSQTPTAPAPDMTGQRVFLVGFSPNEQVRLTFEDRLQSALIEHDVSSVQSHLSIPTYSALEHARILAGADAENAALILVVRRLAVDAEGYGARIPPNVDAATRTYRTLQNFLASADQRPAEPPPPSRQVVEVYGYARGGTGARLIWSGYSWVDFDGNLDTAIGETAELIATNMARSRDAIRANPGGTL